MKRYRALTLFIPAFYLLYLSVAWLGGRYSPINEYFPAFNWSLFSEIKYRRGRAEAEIIAINGVPLPQPTTFYHLPDRFLAARRKDSTPSKLIARIVSTEHRGEKKAAAALRKVFEQQFLSEYRRVDYRLVVNIYNPLERWRTGAVIRKEIVGEYTAIRRTP